MNMEHLGQISGDITFLKGSRASVSADPSSRDIENAVLGLTDPPPQDWLKMLSQVLKKGLSSEVCQGLNGKKFSEVTDIISKKLGLPAGAISSPKDLIAVLLLKTDLEKTPRGAATLGKMLNNRPMSDILNDVEKSLKPVANKIPVNKLKDTALLYMYLAARLGPGEDISKCLGEFQPSSLLSVAGEHNIPVSELAQLLIFLKRDNTPLNENSLTISIAAYKHQQPETGDDLQRTFAYIKNLLASGSLDKIIEDSLGLDNNPALLTQDDFLRAQIFVYDQKAPKLDFKHQNVKEVMDQVYDFTAELNEKLAEQSKAEDQARAKIMGKKHITQKAAADEQDQLTLLKKTSAYVGPLTDASALELKRSDIRLNAYQKQKQQELLRQASGGVEAVC